MNEFTFILNIERADVGKLKFPFILLEMTAVNTNANFFVIIKIILVTHCDSVSDPFLKTICYIVSYESQVYYH